MYHNKLIQIDFDISNAIFCVNAIIETVYNLKQNIICICPFPTLWLCYTRASLLLYTWNYTTHQRLQLRRITIIAIFPKTRHYNTKNLNSQDNMIISP